MKVLSFFVRFFPSHIIKKIFTVLYSLSFFFSLFLASYAAPLQHHLPYGTVSVSNFFN